MKRQLSASDRWMAGICASACLCLAACDGIATLTGEAIAPVQQPEATEDSQISRTGDGLTEASEAISQEPASQPDVATTESTDVQSVDEPEQAREVLTEIAQTFDFVELAHARRARLSPEEWGEFATEFRGRSERLTIKIQALNNQSVRLQLASLTGPLDSMFNATTTRSEDEYRNWRKAYTRNRADLTGLSTGRIAEAEDESPTVKEETQFREWTSTAGTTLEARLVSVLAGTATLEKRDGSKIKAPIDQLSEDDQAFIQAEFKKR